MPMTCTCFSAALPFSATGQTVCKFVSDLLHMPLEVSPELLIFGLVPGTGVKLNLDNKLVIFYIIGWEVDL